MGICWTMAEFTTVAEGRSAERGEARRAEAIYASTVPADCRALIVAGVDGSTAMTVRDRLGGICPGIVGLNVVYEPGSSPRYFSIIDGQASDCTNWNSG